MCLKMLGHPAVRGLEGGQEKRKPYPAPVRSVSHGGLKGVGAGYGLKRALVFRTR